MAYSRKYLLINFSLLIINVIMVISLLGQTSLNVPIQERYEPATTNDCSEFLTPLPEPDTTTFETIIEDDQKENCQNDTGPTIKHFDPNQGYLDRSRTFKIHPFSVTGTHWTDVSHSWNICLSTQTTVNSLFWISRQVEMWKGPMSVALFVPDVDYTIAIEMIHYLKTCFPEVKKRVSFHFVYPKGLPPKDNQMDDDCLQYECEQPEFFNQELMNQIRPASLNEVFEKLAYPQNLMRNIAREGCPADYSFTPDVDMLSIPGISEQLNEFVSRKSVHSCNKCAYLIPTYEIHKNLTTNPTNKEELKVLLQQEKAQRFHVKAYKRNQENSRLQDWEKENRKGSLDILYNINTWKDYWEPIYLAKATVPFYDERFVGYGFTRSSQVFEMHVADYSWHMLNDAFLCHRGFQYPHNASSSRREQTSKNNLKYKKFRGEVLPRYGKREVKAKTINNKGKAVGTKKKIIINKGKSQEVKKEIAKSQEVKKENGETKGKSQEVMNEKSEYIGTVQQQKTDGESAIKTQEVNKERSESTIVTAQNIKKETTKAQ